MISCGLSSRPAFPSLFRPPPLGRPHFHSATDFILLDGVLRLLISYLNLFLSLPYENSLGHQTLQILFRFGGIMLWCLSIARTKALPPWYTFLSVCGCPSFILFLASCCLVGSRRRRLLKLLFGSALSNSDVEHWRFLPCTLSLSKSACSIQSLTLAWSFQEKIMNDFNVTKH